MSSKSVKILFCGAWGYASRFRRVKAFLVQHIPGLVVTGEATPTASGAFEVIIVGGASDGMKVWSKLDGQGYLDADQQNMQKVADAIKNAP